jgi:hypothetical protein
VQLTIDTVKNISVTCTGLQICMTLYLKKHDLCYRTNPSTRSCEVKTIFTSLFKATFMTNVPKCLRYIFMEINTNVRIRQTTFLMTLYKLKRSLVRRTLLVSWPQMAQFYYPLKMRPVLHNARY